MADSETGKWLTPAELEEQLDTIKEMADKDGWVSYPIGAMTTENRDKWTEVSCSSVLQELMGRLVRTCSIIPPPTASPFES